MHNDLCYRKGSDTPMRIIYSVLYLMLIFALLGCSTLAKRSDKPTRDAVAFLESALIPPVLGNLFIVGTSVRITALVGCYLYYVGMDLVLYSLVNFTNKYCKGVGNGTHKPTVMYIMLAVDAVQMLMNTVTHHAFELKKVIVADAPYYKMVPHWGQTLHRVIDYSVFLCVLMIFVIASVKTPKITREKYTVILATMIGVGLLLSYNIFFQYAIDRSMLGFGLFGIIIFYFAIRYRPLRLLDRVLSNIVSGLNDSFYIFDPTGNCIWANEQGCRLAGIEDQKYEDITLRLMHIFGDSGDPDEHKEKRRVGDGVDARFYIIEENQVKDSKGRLDGSFLRIQDVTEEEQKLQEREEQIGQISQEAYRDPLTGVGSKIAYSKRVNELNAMISSEMIQFAVVMVDMNDLKIINDSYGHKAGDLYIKGCCHLICEIFKHSPVFRIGGDEFAVILQGQDYENRITGTEALRSAFAESFENDGLEAWERCSAAVGMAENASDDCTFELVFKRADKAMYEDKKRFKSKYGSIDRSFQTELE